MTNYEISTLVLEILYHTDGPVDSTMDWHMSFMSKRQTEKYRLTIKKFNDDSEIYDLDEIKPQVIRYLKAGAPVVQVCRNGKFFDEPATIF